MNILWLPYIVLDSGKSKYRYETCEKEPIRIGNEITEITIYPDKDYVWTELGIQRPRYFNSYVDFPDMCSIDRVGQPCHGTIIVASNEEWLKKHHRQLIAVLYYLTDTEHSEISCCFPHTLGLPRERFYYLHFVISGQDLVRIQTKCGNFLESVDSLRMTPPLPCRTHCPTIRLKIEPHDDVEKPDSERKKKLIEILLSNPEDRIITACLHFFYAQQSDPFIQDFDSDYAHLCACLEACFDIKQSDITKKFVAKLKETYGEDRNFEQLVKGLYACRSHYVHGLSNFSEEEKTTDQRLKDYEKFVQTKGTFSIVRSMCYDVIWIRLIKLCYDDQIKDKLLFRHTNPTGLLIKLLDSTELYKTIKCYTESKKSAEKIASLSLEKQQAFIGQSENFYKYVDWFLIAERPDVPDVVKILKVYLDVYQRIKGSDIDCNDTQTIRELASIFHDNNMIPGESCFRALGDGIRSERMACDFSEPYESDTQNPFKAAIVNVIYRLAVFFGTYCDLDKIGDTSSPEVVTSSPPEPQIRVAL